MRRWWPVLLGGVLLLIVALVVVVVVRRSGPGPQVELPAATQPPAASFYQVLFTTPQRTGTPAPGSPGRLDERLVALIDGTARTIDMAIYDLDLENVGEALVRAAGRGVRVRVVTDTDNLDEKGMQRVRKANIPVVDDKRGAIMHHKFAVLDGEIVVTGSWNFAERDTYRHNNNTVIFRSPDMARTFTGEFEKMFTGHAFGPTKPKEIVGGVIEAGGTRIETWFASERDPVPAIVERINGASSSVLFMAFSFTQDDIGRAIEARAGAGVPVWGVIETTGADGPGGEYGRLSKLHPRGSPPCPGLAVPPAAVLKDGNPYLMHHKVIVLDGRTVIFGSFNFTASAEKDNDEALLIVDDPAMAAQFTGEFCRVQAVAAQKASK